jgi:hypothetical protein
MNFWNDYEGRTIADKFPLEKLLYPEGRSGFFTTNNGSGTPAIIRLTESLNDEKDIFAQWQTICDLNHPNLIAIKSFGQTVVDDTPLIFAVLEPSDASLNEILKERTMTADETREIAVSLISAIKALHRAGLFQGHVEPASVLAVSEVIKLRSDCVRKLPEGPEGERLKALEVQDFATLLLEALTQQRRQRNPKLPVPFDAIIRNGIAGTWGLDEMSRALEPEPAVATVPASATTQSYDTHNTVEVQESAASAVPGLDPQSGPPSSSSFSEPSEPWPHKSRPWIVLGGVLLVLILSIAYFLHRAPTSQPAATTSANPPAPPAQPTPVPNQSEAPPPATAPPAGAVSPSVETPSTAAGQEVWRVVAYTYNKQDQAQHKVDTINQRHSSLTPEVFTPSGHAPYLVTLGGPMSHGDAVALRRKAQSEGLPRDTYVQNYEK